MSQQTSKGKDQSHLPPSLRVGPSDVPYSTSEQAILDQAGQGATWKCHDCKHGVVVQMHGTRGKRTFCALARVEMREVTWCKRYEAERGA